MPTTGTKTQSPDLSQVFDSWFEVTVKILKTKIAKLQVRDSGDLFDSINYELQGASEFLNRGILSFNFYGKFVDMGVGREFSRGNSGNVQSKRRRKEWYSRVFYAQVMRLREITQQKFGQDAARAIVSNIEAVNDLKYAAYRSQDLARNSRNYRKQTLLPTGQRTWVKVPG